MKTLKRIKIVEASIIVIGVLCLTTSCRTSKEIKGSMNPYEAKEFFSLVVNNSLEFQTFSGRTKTTLRLGNNGINVSGYLRIIKNEKLQLSFQAPILGEMVRFTASKDSLILVDRMHKQYVAESLQNLTQMSSFDFDLSNLQALFTNQLFLIGKPAITTDDFRLFIINQEKEQALISTKDKNINYTFTVDYTDHIRNILMTSNDGKTTMSWSYDNFSLLENKYLFPMQMGMELNNSNNKLSMNFTFSKVELNNELEIDLNIPKNYNRITLAQALILINILI